MTAIADKLRRSLTIWMVAGVAGTLVGLWLLLIASTDTFAKALAVVILIVGIALIAGTVWMRLSLEKSAGESGK